MRDPCIIHLNPTPPPSVCQRVLRVCVCVCVCARARVRASVRVCGRLIITAGGAQPRVLRCRSRPSRRVCVHVQAPDRRV
jgi:hypothetical protein